MSDKILRVNEVTLVTGLSQSTIRRLEKSDCFPKRIKIANNAIGWLKSEVDAWIDSFKIRVISNVEVHNE